MSLAKKKKKTDIVDGWQSLQGGERKNKRHKGGAIQSYVLRSQKKGYLGVGLHIATFKKLFEL